MTRLLSGPEREHLARWVEEKFHVVAAEQLYENVDVDEWERIDPWVAEHIGHFGKFDRFPGSGRLEGHMVVRVVLEDPFVDVPEPLSGMWAFGDLKRHGFNPLDNDEVAEFAAKQWEHLFGDDEIMAYETLGDRLWIPRGQSNANADGVSTFARVAGAAGFYVFDVKDKVVIGTDYDVRDVLASHWTELYSALTGRDIGQLRGPR